MTDIRPLKIALVTSFYPPYNFGGDGIYVQRLARALVQLGCAVTVIHDIDAYKLLADKSNKAPIVEPSDDGVTVIGIESGLGSFSSLMTQQFGVPLVTKGRLKDILSDGFDVIHYHNVSLIGGPAILSYGEGIKLYTAHEHWLVCPSHILWRHNREICDGRECIKCQLIHKRPPQPWRYVGNPARHYKHIDQFIALSQASADNHKQFGFEPEMQVMPSFLPDFTEDTWAVMAKQEHPNGGRPYVFFAGRLEVIKGLQDVVPQFGDDAPLDLLIAGSGSYEGHLRDLAGTSTSVKFLGRMPPADLDNYYQNAVAVIAPSRCYEVFPLVVLEAFRTSTPIIARDLGAYREIIDETDGGFLFTQPEQIIPQLEALLTQPDLRAEKGQNARRAFETRWSREPALRAHFELIRDIGAKKGSQRVQQLTQGILQKLGSNK